MFSLNLKQLLLEKGIVKPHAWLCKQGIQSPMAHKLLNNKYHKLDFRIFNILCTKAHCTPNDILTWTPDAPLPDMSQHPLQALAPKTPLDISKKLLTLSAEKLEAVNKLIDGSE
ncbi:MAG: helix-turn-helix transcriptional regulator [Chitinophagaceae bacterium]|nr:helix-turn-helix transcriptional regulator [Chitinophagaceae bacterium]